MAGMQSIPADRFRNARGASSIPIRVGWITVISCII